MIYLFLGILLGMPIGAYLVTHFQSVVQGWIASHVQTQVQALMAQAPAAPLASGATS